MTTKPFAPSSSETPVRAAGSVLLANGTDHEQVFLVRRSPKLRFLGGFYAFPGGKVDPSDLERTGNDLLEAQRWAGVRELFEEAGLLLARREDGSFLPTSETLTRQRRALLSGDSTFEEILDFHQLQVDPDDLRFGISLVTPPFSPVRFDTAFFVAVAPTEQVAEVWPGELDAGSWCSAVEAIDGWNRGELLLSPPTQSILDVLRGHAITDLPSRCKPVAVERSRAVPEILFSPSVQMIPLDADGLPPTTHTNTYLVGTGPRYLIDPGPRNPDQQAILFDILDRHASMGRPITSVVLTHHHRDHIGAARACAERYGVPVAAHPITAKLLADKVEVTEHIEDGQELDLGDAPHERGRWSMKAILTPGHAPGHLVFHEPDYGLLFAGDMVSTMSSMIIAPPEGDLAQYIASLNLCKGMPTKLVLPSHGGPSTRAEDLFTRSIAHRRQRERQLLEALGEEPRPIEELVGHIYPNLGEESLRFAEYQVLAGLLKLQAEETAVESDEGWCQSSES